MFNPLAQQSRRAPNFLLCFFLCFLVSVISATVLTLVYKYSSDEEQGLDATTTWNFSRLDRLTLAAFLDKQSVSWVIILLMYTYSAIAYVFLYNFSSKMSEFEFYS